MRKDIAIAATGKLITLFSLVALPAILARTLQPSEFGVYMLYAGTVPFVATLSLFALNQITMRKTAHALAEQKKLGSMVQDGMLRAIGSSTIFCAVICAFFLGLNTEQNFLGINKINFVLAMMWGVLMAVQLALCDLFKAFNNPIKTYLFGESGSAICATFSVIMFVCFGTQSLELVIIINIISVLLFIVIGWRDITKTIYEHDKNAESSSWMLPYNYSEGIKIWVASSMGLMVYPVSLWILSYYGTTEEAGDFSIAHRIAMLTIMPALVVNSLMPRRITEYKINKNKKEEIQNLNMIAIMTAILTVMAVYFVGEKLIYFIFGEGHDDAIYLTNFLQIGRLVSVLCGASALVLVIYQLEKQYIAASIIGVITLLLVIQYSVTNDFSVRVALGLMGCAITQNIYQCYIATKAIGFLPWGIKRFK